MTVCCTRAARACAVSQHSRLAEEGSGRLRRSRHAGERAAQPPHLLRGRAVDMGAEQRVCQCVRSRGRRHRVRCDVGRRSSLAAALLLNGCVVAAVGDLSRGSLGGGARSPHVGGRASRPIGPPTRRPQLAGSRNLCRCVARDVALWRHACFIMRRNFIACEDRGEDSPVI